MVLNHLANEDFERATVKAFWRRVKSWFTGSKNELLPFDEVRKNLPLRGQRYIGMRQVPINLIVGSAGRYLDFDRSFLPTQSHTKSRWVSIDLAHHQRIDLPPVELYKIGKIYFVKDGNHRVSVARERGQDEIDAYVIELDVPIPITNDLTLDNLELKKAYAVFMEDTGLYAQEPPLEIDAANPETYTVLKEHIAAHRWFLGEQRKREVSWFEAALSWFSNVYMPLVETMRSQDIKRRFPEVHEADLYVWIMEYQWFLRQPFDETSDLMDTDQARQEAARRLTTPVQDKLVNRLAQVLRKASWIEDMVLQQERAFFLETTGLVNTDLADQIECRQPWNYRRLLEHITVHRWYLGEERRQPVTIQQASESWYQRVYLPLVTIIRETNLFKDRPGVGEGDLYLWVVSRRDVEVDSETDDQ